MTPRLRIAAGLLCLTFVFAPAGQAQFGLGDSGAESDDQFGQAVARGDFNGDGYQDLAVGLPGEDITVESGQISDAGAVEVLYGTAAGVSAAARQFWRQGAAGLDDAPELNDRFGWTLAGGDFNGDGFDDLVIGVPFEDLPGRDDAGAVHVLYGSAAGLSVATITDQFWHDGNSYFIPTSDTGIRFGASLAAADFNGDGHDDLAIGMPGEDLSGCWLLGCTEVVDAGRVLALYGSAAIGLSTTRRQFWSQSESGTDRAEEGDHFGSSLAAGDFNGDGFSDLAVAASGESVGDVRSAGAVSVIHGSADRLTAAASHFWHQNKAGISDIAESGDCFGCSLAAGDFNGDHYDDLAIGVPGEDLLIIERGTDAGAVHVLHGSPMGLNGGFMRDQFWHQNVPDVQDRIESHDSFGAALTAGDFNGDGFDDLAIGIRGEDVDALDVGTVGGAGAVSVIHGSALGLSSTTIPDQLWHQARTGIEDSPEQGDFFGWSVAAGDFNGDGLDDLVVGVPWEDLPSIDGTLADAGGVSIIYGSFSGLNATTVPDQFWTQIWIRPQQP